MLISWEVAGEAVEQGLMGIDGAVLGLQQLAHPVPVGPIMAWVELANVMFDFPENMLNRQRHHSALGYRAPIEYELLSNEDTIPTEDHYREWCPSCRAGQRGARSCSSPTDRG